MTNQLVIGIAQINPVVGDILGNVKKVHAAWERLGEADLIIYPELVISGYPAEDLVMKPAFAEECRAAVERLAADTVNGPAMLVGLPWLEKSQLYNAVALLDAGQISAVRYKVDLPNYDVFDEKRVFSAGPMPGPINFRDVRIGVPICEDIWSPDVVECLEESGAELLLVPNSSPFELGKPEVRLNHVVARVTESNLPLVYVNQVGGQDELVFDGASFVIDGHRQLRAQLSGWEEDFALTRWQRDQNGSWSCAQGTVAKVPEGLASIYQAAMLGLRDYVNKNGFPGVILGLSGGIDSALSAALAVDALGADRVRCVMMPSPYTSQESLEDAAACAAMLGIEYESISIGPAMQAFQSMLEDAFLGTEVGVTEENIQSRSRGLTLMALSNKFGHMVLSTGNKSEMAVGYATLYGDMCGGYNAIKDIYKTTVFQLSQWRNQYVPLGGKGSAGAVMPERIISKPPSAELRPDQKDEDSLPPYDELDGILQGIVEDERSVADLVAAGYNEETVRRVWRLLDLSEYKRRQAPPGPKITRKNFGKDRRYPITNGFRRQI
ncbi:MAG: NAD+ synthase [Rhodospirillales bacterium]|jgi:NAD+ synthase